jgi:hypothetical protein
MKVREWLWWGGGKSLLVEAVRDWRMRGWLAHCLGIQAEVKKPSMEMTGKIR